MRLPRRRGRKKTAGAALHARDLRTTSVRIENLRNIAISCRGDEHPNEICPCRDDVIKKPKDSV